MQKIDRIEFKLNKNDVLTGIVATGATDDDIELLCSELLRCCGKCNSTVEKNGANGYYITPQHQIIINNPSKTYTFLQNQMSDFVNDIGFVRDKSADIILDLLEALQKQLSEKSDMLAKLNCSNNPTITQREAWITNHEISRISTLIHYVHTEKWDCHCEKCGDIILLADILKTHSTLCIMCSRKSH